MFEENKGLVVEAFQRGEFDFVEGVDEVDEAEFLRVLAARGGMLQNGAAVIWMAKDPLGDNCCIRPPPHPRPLRCAPCGVAVLRLGRTPCGRSASAASVRHSYLRAGPGAVASPARRASRRRGRRLPARGTLAAACLAACALWSAAAEAGGFHISVIGGRRNGMLANLAAPDDATAIFHNPAGLADLPGLRIEAFGSAAFLSNEFRLAALDPARFPEINPEECGEAGSPACPWVIGDDGYYARSLSPESTFGVLPFLGVSTDLGFVSDRLGDVVVGLAAYAPDFYGGVMSSGGPTAYFITKGYFLVLATTFGLGWRLDEHLSLGFNVSYNYMRMDFGQRLSLSDALTPEGEAPGGIARTVQMTFGDAALDYTGVDHGAGWTVSLLARPASWLSFGLAYSVSSPARFEGPLGLVPTRAGADSFEELEALGFQLPTGLRMEMPIPPAVNVGVNVAPLPWLEIGFDCRMWLYHLYEIQRIRPLYGPGPPGTRPMTEESLSRPRNDHLSYEIALGLLFRPIGGPRSLELMAGAGYDRSPVPDEYFSLDNPSLSTILFSGGVRWQFAEHWRATLAYIGMLYVDRDIRGSRTSPPTNARGGGSNQMPSLEVEYRF